MYIILSISIAGLIISWMQLRRLSLIWIQRSITAGESIIAGTFAWLFLFSLLLWLGGILLLCVRSFNSYKITDIGILIFSIFLTWFVIKYYAQSRYDLHVDEILDFWKEAIQFRRVEQRKLDVLSLMNQDRKRNEKQTTQNSISREHILLQANLDKGKEQETQLALLRKGTDVNLTELWNIQTQTRSSHPLFEKIQEARIEPNKKRLFLYADFPDLNKDQLKDENVVLRLNRQVYDFFQSMNSEPWLKPYAQYYETYFLICRTMKKIQDGAEIMYPFMKVEVQVSELRKLEGSYFNPRRLSEIAALTFNDNAQLQVNTQ